MGEGFLLGIHERLLHGLFEDSLGLLEGLTRGRPLDQSFHRGLEKSEESIRDRPRVKGTQWNALDVHDPPFRELRFHAARLVAPEWFAIASEGVVRLEALRMSAILVMNNDVIGFLEEVVYALGRKMYVMAVIIAGKVHQLSLEKSIIILEVDHNGQIVALVA